jgi:hypothetical protein
VVIHYIKSKLVIENIDINTFNFTPIIVKVEEIKARCEKFNIMLSMTNIDRRCYEIAVKKKQIVNAVCGWNPLVTLEQSSYVKIVEFLMEMKIFENATSEYLVIDIGYAVVDYPQVWIKIE